MFGPADFRDPHPLLERLLRERPVGFDPELGRWIVTRYDDALAVLRDVVRFSSAVVPQLPAGAGGQALDRFRLLSARWLFFLDPPRHGPERAPVARALAPAAVDGCAADLRAAAGALLERQRAKGGMDVVADYAHPLAVRAVGALIGPPDRFSGCCADMEAAGRDHGHRPTWERGLAAMAAATAAVDEVVAAAATPLVAALLEAERAGALDREAVCAHVLVLLFAGVETTQNQIANAVHTLLRHPGARAHADTGAVVEECLRYEPPVLGVLRRAREPVVLGGQTLRAGDEVVVLLAAANRDGGRFHDAQRCDPARAENPHLSFGFGPHYCPGAALARLTTRVALEVLLAEVPRLRLAAATIGWRDHDPIVRGPRTLPVEWS